jgi:site-specific DNA-methyltransferase (adenine-specific)
MELNKIHNLDFLNNDLPDKCAKLIIADPPYYKTKGDFDFIWKTCKDYLVDVEKWCLECKRILADNGTLLWYGGSKNIAYAQIIFDKHFNLINNLTWNKGSFMGLEQSEGLRSFAPCTERILMYEHKKQFDFICDDIKNYLIVEKAKSKLTLTDLNEILIGKRKSDLIAKRYFGTSQWELPTKEMYLKLQTTGFFKREFEDLRREFEDLRREFEDLRRPFNNVFNLQEVLNYSNEAVKVGNKYDHDTVKPETLTRALILTCSRENDLIVVPFSGSGTEVAMSAKEKRPFIGYEITKKHADMSQARANKILTEPTMF